MASIQKKLVRAQLSTTAADLYTVPAGTRAVIWRVTVENVTASPVVISVWAVPSGGSPADSNILIKQQSVPAFGSGPKVLDIANHVLESGEKLRADAGSNSALTLAVSGVEVT